MRNSSFIFLCLSQLLLAASLVVTVTRLCVLPARVPPRCFPTSLSKRPPRGLPRLLAAASNDSIDDSPSAMELLASLVSSVKEMKVTQQETNLKLETYKLETKTSFEEMKVTMKGYQRETETSFEEMKVTMKDYQHETNLKLETYKLDTKASFEEMKVTVDKSFRELRSDMGRIYESGMRADLLATSKFSAEYLRPYLAIILLDLVALAPSTEFEATINRTRELEVGKALVEHMMVSELNFSFGLIA